MVHEEKVVCKTSEGFLPLVDCAAWSLEGINVRRTSLRSKLCDNTQQSNHTVTERLCSKALFWTGRINFD